MHRGYLQYKIGQPREGLSCEKNPDLKVICIPEDRVQNYWFKDNQATFSTTCEPAATEAAENNLSLNLYPNPAKDILHITTRTAVGGTIIITNALGQQVLQQPIVGETTDCAVGAFAKGLYMVALHSQEGGSLGQSKLVVE